MVLFGYEYPGLLQGTVFIDYIPKDEYILSDYNIIILEYK